MAKTMTDLSSKKVFTTGEVARICKVSQQTVIRCFDKGRLSGFRVPGSRFRRIPREALIAFMKANDIPSGHLDSGKKRILIVDDDAAIVEMLVELLTRDGRFEVRTAATGYDAGILTEQFRPDAILLDVMMPDMDGPSTFGRIQSDASIRHIPVILLTAKVQANDRRRFAELGVMGVIAKPFDALSLPRDIAEVLGWDL